MAAKGYNGNGCGSPLAMASQQWQTPTGLEAAGRDYTYANGDHSKPFLTLTGQARGGMRQGTARRLNPRFVGWLCAFPPDWCDEISRVDALRCFGNSVVWPQGAYAIAILWRELVAHQTREEAAS